MAEYRRPSFINKQVAEITGMNPKTIAYYSNRGFIIPTISKGKGQGSNRVYSESDCLKFMLIPVLADHGLTLEKIGRIFEQITTSLFNPSNPLLYHGLPWTRAILGIYDSNKEDLTAQIVFPAEPETNKGEVKKNFEENLSHFTVDMLKHKSVLVIDITEYVRHLPKVD